MPPSVVSNALHITLVIHAAVIARQSSADMLSLLWELSPLRVAAMVAMDVFKGLFPAFRGYSQALIINEVSLRRLL